MTTKAYLQRRLDRLEAAKPQAQQKPYVSVGSEAEITPALLASRVKIYFGVNPDDWPD